MQGALIGFGTIGMGHLAAYQQIRDVSISAIVDPVPERRIQAAAIYPKIKAFETIEAARRDIAIDFIDICSPPDTHFDYIVRGLESDHHVLCEKPLLRSVRDYRGILSLIKKANRVLYPCHNYKFAPALKLMQAVVRSSDFGHVLYGCFRTLRSGHAVGVPEWNPHWRRNIEISGGGILRDHGTHSIYMASHITKQVPNSVSCLMGNLRNDSYQSTEDTALLTLNFGNNVSFFIELSWAASIRNSYYAVCGTSGNVIIDNDRFCHTDGHRGPISGYLASQFNDPSHKSWFIDMFEDFREVVSNPDRQLPLLQEALVTSLVIERAYESALRGGVLVNVPYPSEELL
jgi:predicted dehydrogenase